MAAAMAASAASSAADAFASVHLDAKIRDFAMVPIIIAVVTGAFIRNDIFTILKSAPPVDMKQVLQNNVLNRSKLLRSPNARFLPPALVTMRRQYFCKEGTGVLCNAPDGPATPQGGDTAQMATAMKTQVVFIVMQGTLAYWVSHLFSGFLVAKAPFPLTYKFKATMQRGVDVAALDPSYVSGLCFYFLVMITLSGMIMFTSSLRGTTDDPNAHDPMMMMGMGPAPSGAGAMGAPDPKKVFTEEKSNLEVTHIDFALEGIEAELRRKWKGSK